MRDDIFTVGGVLARFWHPAYPLLPWALASAVLTVAALWGHWNDGAPVEWVVLGLAAYELMIGLLHSTSVDRRLESSIVHNVPRQDTDGTNL